MDDPVYERDVSYLIMKYMRGDFFYDCLANLPIFVYEAVYGFPHVYDGELTNRTWYLLFMHLKFFRFFHLDEVTDALTRVKEILAQIFYLHRYMFENLLSWTLAATKLLICINLFACGWIKIQKVKIRNEANFIEFEEQDFFG